MSKQAWSSDTYNSIKRDYSKKTTNDIFKSEEIDPSMDPKLIKGFRESRDSAICPNSLAVALFLDETGSMGDIPAYLIKNKLGALMTTLIDHGVPDAHLLFGGIGDQYTDQAPLQVGQFEAGTKELDLWLTKIFLEGNGGGQNMESYSLAWLLAARHTSIDCFEKRGEKGFLFTVGDEWVHPVLDAASQKKIMGYTQGEDITAEQLLAEAQRMYHVYHLYVETGYHLLPSWKKLMGENVLFVEDKDAIAEIVASTVAIVRGAHLHDVTKNFDSKTSDIVSRAVAKVESGVSKNSSKGVFAL